jgi:hypothetical protein
MVTVALRIMRNACVLDKVRIVDFVLRRVGDDPNMVVDSWASDTNQLEQLRRRHGGLRQRQLLPNWPNQGFAFKRLLTSLHGQLTLLAAGTKTAKESLLSVAVLSNANAVVDFITNHPNFDHATDTMPTLRKAIERNSQLSIALRLPNIRINGVFDDGTSPLTALFVAKGRQADSGMMTRVEQLLAVDGVDVNRPDAKGRLFLLELLKIGTFIPVTLMGRRDVDWNVADRETGDTPLILVARRVSGMRAGTANREPLLVQMLKKRQIDVNARNKEGNTALIEAVMARNAAGFSAIAGREDCRLDIQNDMAETVFSLTKAKSRPDAKRAEIIKEISAVLLEMSDGAAGDDWQDDLAADMDFVGDDD